MIYPFSNLTKDELVSYLQVFHGKYAPSYYENERYEELLKLYNELLQRGEKDDSLSS